ncbi:SDR family NAD(P)-dependent oxidoreductase, partial [Acidobacteriota bacterium]
FFSDMLEYLQMAKKGRGYVFGSGEYRINPIHGEDLAEVCVNAAAGGKKEINVGGPDVLTHNEILTIAFESLGKTVKISRIPIWIGDLLLAILRIFTSVKTYGPLEFFMTVLTRDMVAPSYGKYNLKDFFMENTNIDKTDNY